MTDQNRYFLFCIRKHAQIYSCITKPRRGTQSDRDIFTYLTARSRRFLFHLHVGFDEARGDFEDAAVFGFGELNLNG